MAEKEFVMYRGSRMGAGWPEKIQQAQRQPVYVIEGQLFPRIRYGEEAQDWGADSMPCHDCAVLKGELHVPRCDVERCPKCKNQAISCSCKYEDAPEIKKI